MEIYLKRIKESPHPLDIKRGEGLRGQKKKGLRKRVHNQRREHHSLNGSVLRGKLSETWRKKPEKKFAEKGALEKFLVSNWSLKIQGKGDFLGKCFPQGTKNTKREPHQ